jgi:predicted phosphohydrolase
MKIQIYSDIHLEFYKSYPKIDPLSDYLFLAGDIGKLHMDNYKDFFNYCSKNWKEIFYVLGNHEYYHSKKTIDKLNNQYKDFFKNYSNIHLLDKDIFVLNDYIILGCTLWSKATYKTEEIINDFSSIKIFKEDRKKNINFEDYNNLNKIDKKFLLENIEKYNDKIVILTHFPLIQNTNPKYNNQEYYLKNYFGNNIDLPDDKEITIISGHTHWSYDFKIDNKRYISNQFGYLDEMESLNINGVYHL